VSVPAGRIVTVTTASGHRQRGFLLSLLTLLTLAGAFLAPAVDASASTRVGIETRVRAIDTPTTALVGRVDAASSTTVGVSGLPLRQQASATGAATEAAGTRRVGRWMGADEHAAMVNSGEVQVGSGGTTYVSSPASAKSYLPQATAGSHYVEFDVPSSSLRPAGQLDWAQIPSPENTMWGKLAPQRGWPVPESPVSACNIVHVATKLSC